MPRRSGPRRPPAAAGGAAGAAAGGGGGAATGDHTESAADGDWIVRTITGSSSTRVYRCPGCDHEIRPATPHLVVWSTDDPDAGDRRHWHRICWRSRGRRNPGRSRW